MMDRSQGIKRVAGWALWGLCFEGGGLGGAVAKLRGFWGLRIFGGDERLVAASSG